MDYELDDCVRLIEQSNCDRSRSNSNRNSIENYLQSNSHSHDRSAHIDWFRAPDRMRPYSLKSCDYPNLMSHTYRMEANFDMMNCCLLLFERALKSR